MALYLVYFKKNPTTKLEPVKFEPRSAAADVNIPFVELRQAASVKAQEIDADYFAFYGGRGTRASMIFDKWNRVNHFVNSEKCWPVNIKTVSQLKKM